MDWMAAGAPAWPRRRGRARTPTRTPTRTPARVALRDVRALAVTPGDVVGDPEPGPSSLHGRDGRLAATCPGAVSVARVGRSPHMVYGTGRGGAGRGGTGRDEAGRGGRGRGGAGRPARCLTGRGARGARSPQENKRHRSARHEAGRPPPPTRAERVEAGVPRYPRHTSSSLASNWAFRPQKTPIPAVLFSTQERSARSGPAGVGA